MWILFEEQLPKTGTEITIRWNDGTEDNFTWYSIMGSAIDWNKSPYPIGWKLKE